MEKPGEILLPGERGRPCCIAFSPDGALLAAGSSEDDRIVIWDWRNKTVLRTLAGHGNGTLDAAFSPDGAVIATCCWDHTINFWESGSGKWIKNFDAGKFWPQEIRFSKDGETVFTSEETPQLGSVLRRWHIATGKSETVVAIADDTDVHFEISADERTMFLGTEKGIEIRDMGHPNVQPQVLSQPRASLTLIALAKSGRRCACSNGFTVRIWEFVQGKAPVEILPKQGSDEQFHSLAFSPIDDRLLAVSLFHGGGATGVVTLWNATSAIELARLDGAGSALRMIAFSPDGNWLAAADLAGPVKIWDVRQIMAGIKK